MFGKACPLFCPLVEEGWLKDPVTVEVANRYLEPLLATGIDTLVMGCTHYPLLRSTLREIMGDKVNLVNPAYETALELKALLEEKGLATTARIFPPKENISSMSATPPTSSGVLPTRSCLLEWRIPG